MIKLFKAKEKERQFAENANTVFNTFSNMSIDENADSYGMAPVKQQSAWEMKIAENADRVFSIFSNMNIAENADNYVRAPVRKQSPGQLRLYKDISELSLPKTTAIVFPNGKDDLMQFSVYIWPDEGCYSGGLFQFTFEVSPIYPHEPPNIKCKTKVYHPNIDLEGNVGLNILHKAWNPVLSINTIIHGLHHLFLNPSHVDPLNHDAASALMNNPEMFVCNVRRGMAGNYVGQTNFHRCLEFDVHSVLFSTLKHSEAVIML